MDRVPQLLYVPRSSLIRRKRRIGIVAVVLFLILSMGLLWYGMKTEERPEGAIRVQGGNSFFQVGTI